MLYFGSTGHFNLSSKNDQPPPTSTAIYWYLKNKDSQHYSTDAVHQAHVVTDQSFSAATDEDVEVLGLVLIVVVGWVVGQFVLDAGSRGAWVAAAEGHTIH